MAWPVHNTIATRNCFIDMSERNVTCMREQAASKRFKAIPAASNAGPSRIGED